MRRAGNMLSTVESIAPYIREGSTVAVVGCTNPTLILDLLKSMGVDAEAEVMSYQPNIKAVYDEEGIIGFEPGGEPVISGYAFKLKADNGSESPIDIHGCG